MVIFMFNGMKKMNATVEGERPTAEMFVGDEAIFNTFDKIAYVLVNGEVRMLSLTDEAYSQHFAE